MKKESKIILSIIVILLVAIVSYFVGYKKAYNDYESFLNNNDNGVKYQSFYATITDIEDTGLTIDDTALTVKGLDINDINFRGIFKFVITEATEIEWRYTKLDTSELEIGDKISIIFTGNIQESEPAKIEDVLKIQLLDDEIKEEVKELVKRFVKTDGDNPAIIVDNADWICEKTYVDFMRDIGVHFNVNTMLSADCYKKRLESGGLTFLEMGYMLMQAFDFVHLNKEFNCCLQIGGSDQWGNILAGVDLSRKIGFSEGKKIDPLFGFVCPLLLKADGEKMGKTATGTLWVSREKTSAFEFFQAWINSFDEDVERSLAFFTRMEMEDIRELCQNDIREAKKILAFEVTKLVHGEDEAIKSKQIAEELFSNKGVSENI